MWGIVGKKGVIVEIYHRNIESAHSSSCIIFSGKEFMLDSFIMYKYTDYLYVKTFCLISLATNTVQTVVKF